MDGSLSGCTSSSEVNVNNTEKEKEDINNADSDWIEENILVEDQRLKLNISNIKKMAKPEMHTDCWYIVADKDILLYHLYFLNTLCNSDDDCCLMVAQQVMADLRSLSAEGLDADARRARRAVCFLHKQLDDGYLVIADGTCGENATRCDYILSCCSNLLEENYHVILLSNDDGFNSYKNSTDVPIFNMKQIKQFLTKSEPEKQQTGRINQDAEKKSPEKKKPDRLKPPPCMSQKQNRPITITVANEFVLKDGEDLNPCKVLKNVKINLETQQVKEIQVNEETQTNNDSPIVDEPNLVVVHDKSGENVNKDNFILPEKYTSEVAVQTDTERENAFSCVDKNDSISTPMCPPEDKEIIVVKAKQVDKDFTAAESTRKEIRLNRSTSVKTTTSSEDSRVETKQFKWRRRRNIGCNTQTNNSKVSLNSCVDESSRDSINTQKNDSIERKRYDESICSETSSLIITKNNFNDSLVIEETSTSGIISNSTIDSETENGNRLSNSMLSNFKQLDPIKSVMYKVTDKEMEESLRTMNDEWISRFTQIIEEVLTQVLRKDEGFLVNVIYKLYGGGPWTICEAAECIQMKFSNDRDIVDAATKLSNVFKRISDDAGRITANLEPSEYMEMYSFGVYLVVALRRARRGCEDVGSAARALQALLADIRSPHTRAFADHSHSQVPKSTDEPEQPLNLVNEGTEYELITPVNSPRTAAERSYNLRSKNRSQEIKDRETEKEKEEKEVKFIRNFNLRDSFFDSLNLIKKSKKDENEIPSPRHTSNDLEVNSNSQGLIRSIFDRGSNEGAQKFNTVTTVIRKFTVVPEFEKKIKLTMEREPLDMDQLDYTAMYDDDEHFMNEEYYSDDEYYENEHESQVSKNNEKPLKEGNTTVENHPVIEDCDENVYFKIPDDKQFMCDSPINMNKKLNNIFRVIINRVKESLLDVETFCKKTYKELSESRVHSIRRKYEINESAEKTLLLLDNLRKSLNSILYRETFESEKSIQSVLKEEGINDFSLNDNLLQLYRDAAGKCVEQSEILRESVTLIISVIKKQPIE